MCVCADNPKAGGIAGNIGINNYDMANPLICSQVSDHSLHHVDCACCLLFQNASTCCCPLAESTSMSQQSTIAHKQLTILSHAL